MFEVSDVLSEASIKAHRRVRRLPPRMPVVRERAPQAERDRSRDNSLGSPLRGGVAIAGLAVASLQRGLRALPRRARAWVFLVGAAFCIMLTFLVKISMTSWEARGAASATTVSDAAAENAVQLENDPAAATDQQPRPQQPAPVKAPPEPKKALRTISADELAALNGAAPLAPVRPNASAPREDLVLGGSDVAAGSENRAPGTPNPPDGVKPDGQNADDAKQVQWNRDPATGAWFNLNNIWEVREQYSLPLDGHEINGARFALRGIGVTPQIELEWWSSRTVEVPEKHFRGKITKLRFLAIVSPAQAHQVEGHVRIVRTRGDTAEGTALVEAEAIFYSPAWNLVSTEVKEKPSWFPDSEPSVKRGEAGQLPVKGREIELVRQALRDDGVSGRIRETKWWPPRLNRANGRRMSKLRYEVIQGPAVRIEELVFDYTELKATYGQLPQNLFPEFDRRAARLDQPQK